MNVVARNPKSMLPTNSKGFLDRLATKPKSLLVDHVNTVHLILADKSPEYLGYLEAVFDAEAQEGSMRCDDQEAARLIRAYVRDWIADHPNETRSDFEYLATKRYKAIIQALKHVLTTRYKASRKQRRAVATLDDLLDV